MAGRDTSGPVTLSVLDRLLDDDPKHSAEVPLSRPQSLRALKAGLKRDLEWLLNTRRTIDLPPAASRELLHSAYCYGFADISSRSVLSAEDQGDLVKEMESVIATFEPRLKRVKVRMESVGGSSQSMSFVIEGLLNVDPAPEPVRFDTVLEIGKGEYAVKGEDGAR
jgi:type VI secretion system protein ImpF